MQAGGVDSICLYTAGQGCDYRARMFSAMAGIPKNPAAGRLVRFWLTNCWHPARLAMARPGWRCGKGSIQSGRAVPVSEGRIRVPG